MSGYTNNLGLPLQLSQSRICLQCRRPGFNPSVGKIPWRRKWQPTPVSLPGKSHGWRRLMGYSPWGLNESDTTERLHFTSLLVAQKVESACNVGDLGLIPGLGRSPGEGNGNPLQYPCLENPMDRGAQQAPVQVVSESDTTERLSTA